MNDFTDKQFKSYLKKHYEYEGNLPVKCYLCGNEDIYVGHNDATSMGVQCEKCKLKLSIPYEKYHVGEHWNSKKSYDGILLEMVIKLWNKEVKIEDMVEDIWIRCPYCDDWASEITIRKRRGKKKDCCYHCEKKIDFDKEVERAI